METKQVIIMRTDLNMRKGKMVAQGAHASLGAILSLIKEDTDHPKVWSGTLTLSKEEGVYNWLQDSFTKITVGVNGVKELLELEAKANEMGILNKLIIDDGTTEFNGVKTITCLAIGPAKVEDVDKITGKLKLL